MSEKKQRIKASKVKLAYFIVCIQVILVMLPFMYSLPSIIRLGSKIFCAGFFFIVIMQTQKGFFFKNILWFLLALIVNAYFYYMVQMHYVNPTSFFFAVMSDWFFVIYAQYFVRYGNEKSNKKLSYFIIFIVSFTALTSLIGLTRFPLSVRYLGNINDIVGASSQSLYSMNICNWAMLYGILFSIPFIIMQFKKTHNIIFIVAAIICELCVLKSQITFAILISLVLIFFSVLKALKMRVYLLAAVVFLLSVIIVYVNLADIILFVCNVIGDTNQMVRERLYQVAIVMKHSYSTGDVAARIDRYTLSINSFLSNPFFGAKDNGIRGSVIGLHSQVFDMLGGIGLFGFLPICYIFIGYVKELFYTIRKPDDRNLYVIVMCLFIVLMILNPVYHCPGVFMAVFLLSTLA